MISFIFFCQQTYRSPSTNTFQQSTRALSENIHITFLQFHGFTVEVYAHGLPKTPECSTPRLTFLTSAPRLTLSGKYWSFQSPSPKQEDLFLPHMYRSPPELMAAFVPSPHLMDVTTTSGLNSLRPKRGAGKRVGSIVWSRLGPLPRMP